jgi:hypothetical protein
MRLGPLSDGNWTICWERMGAQGYKVGVIAVSLRGGRSGSSGV